MKISIHQPNFMPWYPYFLKTKEVDKFVILKECQFEKNNYQNRFHRNGKWYTMCVNKGLEPIKDKYYIDPFRDWDKIKTSLQNYKSILDNLDICISECLWKTNYNIINEVKNMLNIKTQLVLDYETELKGTERLVDICKHFHADTYLAGSGGSKEYLDLSLFEKEGIKVEYQGIDENNKIPIIEVLKNYV